ncbi:MAG: nuclear transport factor 2 family protein [Candidatus Solibacter sp.]|nr:nuclear transport factor 2 family protein [Candidatus Solibacter sp.]
MSKQTVMGIYEAFGRGDLAGVLDALADDVEWDMPGTVPFCGLRQGRAAVQQFFVELMGAVKIEMFEVDAVIGDGERVVVLGRERCTAMQTGRSYQQHWAHAYSLRGGKVVAVRLHEDTQAQAAAFNPAG